MTNKKIILMGIGIILAVTLAIVVIAEQNELELELNNLIQELSGGGYSWLVNYSGELGDDCELVTTFENISDENWYKVYLNNLNESETNDVFDLKVKGDVVELDYIVDPASTYNISFVPPTPLNATNTTNTSIEINVSITNADDLSGVKFNWNSTNYTIFNDSLVLMMNFDNVSALGENDTHVVDVSGYGNNGTTSGNPVMNLTGGKYGGAFEFDGEDDYVRVDDFENYNNYTNGLTVSAWIYMPTITGDREIVSKNWRCYQNRGWNLGVYPYNDQIWFYVCNESVSYTRAVESFSGTLAADKWYHVVGIWNTTHTLFYLDGSLVDSDAVPSGRIPRIANNYHMNLGTHYGENTYFFNGTIDEVRIWNRSLSADEIQQSYFSNLNKYDTDKWLLYVNEDYGEPMGSAVYTYSASAKDTTGNENSTETRYLNVNAIIPGINFTAPTPDNGANTTNTSIEINVSITNSSDLDEVIYNWDGTNYTMYNDSLVLMMNFDNVSALGENDTYVVDLSGNGNNGTVHSSPWKSAQVANGLEFDGVNDYVNCGNGVPLDDVGNGDFSVSFWMKSKDETPNNYGMLFSKSQDTSTNLFFLSSSVTANRMNLFFKKGGVGIPNTPFSINSTAFDTNFNHIVLVIDRTTDKALLYMNGVKDSTEIDISSVPADGSNTGDLLLGKRSDGLFYEGLMDEVRIYNRTLNTTEINWSYQKGLDGLVSNVSTEGLVGYWALNESDQTSTASDSSGEGNDGALNNFVFYPDYTPDGKYGGAFEFDATRDYIDAGTGSSLNLGNDFTASAWIKPDALGNYKGIINKVISTRGGVYSFMLICHSDGRIGSYSPLAGWDLSTNAGITAGNWYHVTWVLNGGNMYFYVNGIPYSSAPFSYNDNDAHHVFVGSWHSGTDLYDFDGKIDEVRIWNRSLSADEIQQHYFSNLNKYDTDKWLLYVNQSGLDGGIYTYQAFVADSTGNWNQTEKREISVDIPQVITIVSPLNNSNYNTDTIDFNVSLDETGSWCGFSLNGTANVTMTKFSNTYFNYTKTGLNDATYNITFSCNDTFGNMTSSDLNFFLVDATYPLINFTSPTPPDDNITTNNYVYVNVSTSDANEHSAFIDWNRSLVGWWSFDSYNSTGIYDNSTYDNFGTFTGGGLGTSDIISGKRGKALEFNGVNERVIFSGFKGTDIGTSDFTVTLWTKKFTNTGNYNTLVFSRNYNGDNFGFMLHMLSANNKSTANFYDGVVNTNVIGDTMLQDNTWYHISFTADRDGNGIIYLDGVVDKSQSISAQVNNNLSSDNWGINGWAGAQYWNGSIDEVMIFNRVLTPEEINASYQAGSYRLYHNFTSLSEAIYDYTAHVIDAAGNVNSTETREVTFDTAYPTIEFVDPTPSNGTAQLDTFVYVNVSTSDANEHSAFIDWNRSLVGWWSFDSYNSTGIYDNSTYDNFGKFNGGLSTSDITTGKRGKGLEFDGVDDYVESANSESLNITDELTVEAWFYPVGLDEAFNPHGVVKNNEYILFYVSGWGLGDLYSYISTDAQGWQFVTNSISGSTYLNKWTHMTITYDSTTGSLNLYVNGNLNGTSSLTPSPISTTTNPLQIAARGTTYGIFNGTIDEVRIHNRVLSPQEINASYQAGSYRLYHNFTSLDDATYNYTAHVIDAAGKVNSTDTWEVTIQATVPPVVYLKTPANDSDFNSQPIYFAANYTNLDLKNTTLYIWNSTSLISTNTTIITGIANQSNLTLNLPRDDTYFWNYYACDNADNCAFNSTNWTLLYDTEIPTPTEAEEEAGVTGGGGAGIIAQPVQNLSVIPASFNLPAVVGINSSGKISLSNTGETNLSLVIDLINLDNIIKFGVTSLNLEPGQTQILEFLIIPPGEPGIYTGKISFIALGQKTEIPFALNVNAGQSLFDISVDLPDEYKRIKTGNNLIGQITLIQAGVREKVDVTMGYLIKDFEGNTYLRETETIAVFKEKTYEHEFFTKDLFPGDYLIGAEVIYSGGVATASSQFKVIEAVLKTTNLILLFATIFVLIVLIIAVKIYKSNKVFNKQ